MMGRGLLILMILLGAASLALGHGSDAAEDSAGPDHGPDLAVPAALADTVLAEILFPDGVPSIRSVTVEADTVRFGAPLVLTLRFTESVTSEQLTGWSSSAPWLTLGEVRSTGEGTVLEAGARVHALDFFRLKAGDFVSPVMPVVTAGVDLTTTAPVRMPRLWKTRWWVIILVVLTLALVLAGCLWLWRRRLRLKPLSQWDPPAPAWIEAAPALCRLLDGDTRSRADTHHFCDRLASIVRRYLAGRYLVPAGELTGAEILHRCRGRGFEGRYLSGLTRIIEDLDTHRYNPERPSSAWCRDMAGKFFYHMGEVRILPRYTRVDARPMLEAEQAWAWLHQTVGTSVEVAPGIEGGE